MKISPITLFILVLAAGTAIAQVRLDGGMERLPPISQVRLMPQVEVIGADSSVADQFSTDDTFNNRIYLKQFDLEANELENLQNIHTTDYLSGTTQEYSEQYIQPGDSIDRDITADKIDNIDMDVVPSLVLTQEKYPALPAMRVDLDQTQYAVWRKGPIGVQPDIVLHIPLDDPSGTTATDTSGYSRNGIYQGSPTLAQPGVFQTSVLFDGNNDMVNFNDAGATSMWNTITTTNQFYFSVWIKPNQELNEIAANNVILSRYAATAGGPFLQILGLASTDHFYYKLSDNADTNKCEMAANGDTCWKKGVWSNVVLAYNTTNCLFYCNGTLLDNIPKAIDLNANINRNTTIGAATVDGPTVVTPFNGTLDEFFLSNSTAGTDGYASAALLQYQAAITELSITAPTNNTAIAAPTFQINTTVGANGDLAGIYTYDYNGTQEILNKGTNTTSSLLYTLNATNYIVSTTYVTRGLTNGLNTYYIRACNNGSDITDCTANYTWANTISNPTPVFYNATPADISNFNTLGNGLTLWYSNSGATANISATSLFYGTNATGCFERINGTCTSQSQQNETITTPFFTNGVYSQFKVNDNDVFPTNWNMPEALQSTLFNPVPVSLTSTSNYIMDVYLNSTVNAIKFIEATVNATNSGLVELRLCNSTFVSAPGNPSTSPACTLIADRPLNIPYNHTGVRYFGTTQVTNNMSDMLFIYSENATGYVGSVPFFDNILGMVWRGAGGTTTVNVYTANYNCRNGAAQLTTNNGGTWTNQTYCIVDHRHTFGPNEAFYSYAMGQNNLPDTTQGNSTIRYDLYDLSGLRPTPPNVFMPTEGVYFNTTNMVINYSTSISPNNYPIVYYNVSLYDTNKAYLKTLNISGTPTIFNYNIQLNNGMYYIGVKALDNMGLFSDTGFSANWTSYQIINPQVLSFNLDQTNILQGNTVLATFNIANGTYPLDMVWVSVDSNVINITNAVNATNTLTWPSAGLLGSYTITGRVNDTVGATGAGTPISVTVYTTTTTLPAFLNTNTPQMNTLSGGSPVQAVAQEMYVSTGYWWIAIVIGALFLGVWIRTSR